MNPPTRHGRIFAEDEPMPLRDHFRSPVNDTHSWDEVHGQWPGEIVRDLTTILPAGVPSRTENPPRFGLRGGRGELRPRHA